MKRIQEHINNQTFVKAYLLYGDEDFLKRTYRGRLKSALVGDDEMNFSAYEGKDFQISRVRDDAETLPFFAERRLILMEGTGAFKSSSDELTEIVKNSPETTFFLFVESEVDKRNKLFKLVSEIGYASDCKPLSADDLIRWVNALFHKAGKKITVNDLNYLIQKAGMESDMDNLKNEADKLISYVGDREVVTKEDIDAICVTQASDRVFEMIEAIANQKPDQALKLYADLVTLKEPAMKILTLVSRHFSQLYGIKDLMETRASGNQIAERMGIKPYFVGKMVAQSRLFTVEQLRQAVEDCVEAEHAVKAGIREERYALELVLLKYCQKH